MSLEVDMCGVKLLNPFIVASGPSTATGELIMSAFEKGWGGVVTKTIVGRGVEIKNVSPRIAVIKTGKHIIAMQNIELVTTRTLNEWIEDIKKVKDKYPEHVVIGSVMATYDRELWQEVSKEVEDAGADMLELNLSCPHGMPEKGAGSAIGQNPEMVKEVIGWVKEVVSIPVLAKLTPNVTSIGMIARACEEAGADGISAINTVLGFIGIDVKSLFPKLNVNGKTAFGGISGKAIKPIGLRCVAEILQSTKLPVSGIGGISSWEDAIEYILLGATTVQICTEVMLKGFGIVEKLINGFNEFMESKGYSSVEEFRGKFLSKICAFEELDKSYRVWPVIDRKKCVKCEACVIACRDSGFQAISMEEEGPVVDEARCDGCGLCYNVCIANAITLK